MGYNLGLVARDAKAATELAKALKAEGVPASSRGESCSRDWHLYAYWEHILEQKAATSDGCPFTCPHNQLPAYSPDMCPRTLDLIARSVFVNVNQWWTAKDCRKVAAGINKVCAVLG